jgi:hypothetical protein
MPNSKHNTTKRGTQKQRVKTHDDYIKVAYPELWTKWRKYEFEQAMERK